VFRSFLKDSIDRGEKTIHIVETEKRADYLKRLARFKFFCGVAVVGRNSFAISRVPALFENSASGPRQAGFARTIELFGPPDRTELICDQASPNAL
jgi:hypothetical protein